MDIDECYDTIIYNIINLNKKLNTKCPNLSLRFEQLKKLPNYKDIVDFGLSEPSSDILCLYDSDQCVSNIYLDYYDNSIEISSYTDSDYAGFKFNKLLRCVIVIICKIIKIYNPRFKVIKSAAVNHLSAFTLIKNFNVSYNSGDTDTNIIVERLLSDVSIPLYNRIVSIYKIKLPDKKNMVLEIIILLDEYNLNQAVNIFNNLIDEGLLICQKSVAE